jgi:RND family efflux transporter MFP subunit
MARNSKLWRLLTLVVLATTTAAMIAANRSPGVETAPLADTDNTGGPVVSSSLPIETRQIQPQESYRVQRVFSGRLQARRESQLGFYAAGRLEQVLVIEGEQVRKGTLLATLDTDLLTARRAELVAAQAEAEANLALASATLKRLRGVLQSGGVSRQGLDEAREGRRAAAAALDLARQRIATIDVEREKNHLLAPFDGTVIDRMVDEGRVLATGEPVLRLQESTTPEARIGVAGDAVNLLQAGGIYSLEHGQSKLTARLRAVLPLRSPRTRTVDTLFDLVAADPAGPALRPGDTVNLRLSLNIDEPGYWLPLAALTEGERGLWSVYIVEPAKDSPPAVGAAHRVSQRTVDIIHQDADRVFVRGALQPGTPIITTGLQRVVPGQWVTTTDALFAAGTRR